MNTAAFPPSIVRALRGLARSQPVEVVVRGGCMAPAVLDGERVAVAPARFLLPGDLVVFQAGDGRLRIHRALGWRLQRGRPALVTRGDACPCHDAPVPRGRILGRAAALAGRPVRIGSAARWRALFDLLFLAARRLRP
jgi:hypothetical protein